MAERVLLQDDPVLKYKMYLESIDETGFNFPTTSMMECNTSCQDAFVHLCKSSYRDIPIYSENKGQVTGMLNIRLVVEATLPGVIGCGKRTFAFQDTSINALQLASIKERMVGSNLDFKKLIDLFAEQSSMILKVKDETDLNIQQEMKIITQRDLYEPLFCNEHFLNLVARYRVMGSFVKNPSPLCTVNQDDSMLKASTLFGERKFNALPVVDGLGRMVDVLSSRDFLKFIRSAICENNDYLQEVHVDWDMGVQDAIKKIRPSTFEKSVLIQSDQTWEVVMDKLASWPYDHVWVVNNKQCPLRCISLTDVFRFAKKLLDQC